MKPPFIPEVGSKDDVSNVDGEYLSQKTNLQESQAVEREEVEAAMKEANISDLGNFSYIRPTEMRKSTTGDTGD